MKGRRLAQKAKLPPLGPHCSLCGAPGRAPYCDAHAWANDDNVPSALYGSPQQNNQGVRPARESASPPL